MRVFKCFGLLINGGSVASVSYAFEDSAFYEVCIGGMFEARLSLLGFL